MDKNVRPARPIRALAWLALAALVASPLLVALVGQAATTKTVVMVGQGYNPEDVYIKAGDSVRWRNDDPFGHNVHFENESTNEDVSSGSTSNPKTFPTASGSPFRYYCNIHGDTGGRGMSGRVVINSTGSPPSTPTGGPTATITQSPKPKPTKTATTTSSPRATATATPTSSPTPTVTPTPTPTPTETLPSSSPLPTFAGGDTGSGDNNNLGAVAAIVVVVVLGGAGYLVYRRFIASP